MIPAWGNLMRDQEILKSFGPRLKTLRKKKTWTQKELAAKIGVSYPLLNKYECGLHAPPVSKLIELAGVLNTTVDYLLTGSANAETSLHNLRLLERFQALENFQMEDQEAFIRLIDAVIVKNRAEGLLKLPQ